MQSLIDKAQSLILDKLTVWFDHGVLMLPNLILAVIVVVAFALLARLFRSISRSLLRRVVKQESLAQALSGGVYFMVIAVGLFLALTALKLDKTVTSLLAGAGVVGLALSFAFQDLATNFVSGLFITVQQPLRKGDFVIASGYKGIVERIGLRSITIRDLDGQDIIIPSKDVFQNPLTNFSLIERRRVNLEVGVSYAADLESVGKIVARTVEALEGVDGKNVRVFWTGFGDSSINLVARFWIESSSQADHDRALSTAMVAVKKAFDAEGITIPFPIRTLDFGIEGGIALSQMLTDSRS